MTRLMYGLYGFRRFFNRVWFYYFLRDSCKCAKALGVDIGERCKILDDPGKVFGSEPWLVHVGEHCEFTNGVRIITHEGGVWVARELCKDLKDADILKRVIIGNNVMVGNYALIMPGVTIGDNIIIGGHSVVTHDLESNYVYAGVPARKIEPIEDFVEKVKLSPDRYDVKGMSQKNKKRVFEKQGVK